MSVINSKHDKLQDVAIGWLYKIGCSIFAKEVPTKNGVSDALGIITRREKKTVYYIEAKVSRSDLICPKQKAVYQRSIGDLMEKCYVHKYADKHIGYEPLCKSEECIACRDIQKSKYDMGIDFYYFILADGVAISDSEYPEWGILNEKGVVVRRAKRMKTPEEPKVSLIESIAHVLVYKAFGKLYLK